MDVAQSSPPSFPPRTDPVLISGGMGISISSWELARVVGLMGQLGVVSGTALDVVYARRLQLGDPGGSIRRAFVALVTRCPGLTEPIQRLLARHFNPAGKASGQTFRNVSLGRLHRVEAFSDETKSAWELLPDTQVLTFAANFAEVWLAKEGHAGKVGINYLRKVERPLPWALYGALWANVDYVLVGAGRPSELPNMIQALCRHESVELPLAVHGASERTGEHVVVLQPSQLLGTIPAPLPRPKFLAIVSSHLLARTLAESPQARPYGFVVESPAAGGHNAPPSMKHFNDRREPVLLYGESDFANMNAIADIGLPFWVAGSCGSPQKLREARALGAVGIQVGTLAALSGQSGMAPELREQTLSSLTRRHLRVMADARLSPTGFPFKVAQIPGTLSDASVYSQRTRICDVGHLQTAFVRPDGGLGFRCPAEPVEDFVRKGGNRQSTVGRACLCNALLATAGLAQSRADGYREPAVVTLGNDLESARQLMTELAPGQETYTIGKALRFILGGAKRQRLSQPPTLELR
jgi:NAD(P)H-dependent flavin oxidoreductase YrpB (nitropropane dioxygenase family)